MITETDKNWNSFRLGEIPEGELLYLLEYLLREIYRLDAENEENKKIIQRLNGIDILGGI